MRKLLFVLAAMAVFYPLPALAGSADDIRRGIDWTTRGDLDRAITLYSQVIESPRTSPLHRAWALYTRGIAWFKKGQYDQAIADCTESLEIIPRCSGPHLVRGNAWKAMFRLEQALKDYTLAIRTAVQNKERAMAHHNRSLVWETQGRLREAVKDAQKALELKPDDTRLRLRLARLEARVEAAK